VAQRNLFGFRFIALISGFMGGNTAPSWTYTPEPSHPAPHRDSTEPVKHGVRSGELICANRDAWNPSIRKKRSPLNRTPFHPIVDKQLAYHS
jgi:hypothetical protein